MPHLSRAIAADFGRDTRGAVAILMGLLLLPLLLAVGMVVDYSMAVRQRTAVQSAADAAALAASREAAKYISDNGWSSSNAAIAETVAVAAARTTFAANASGVDFSTDPTVSPTVSIPSAQSITASVTVDASVPTSIMRVVGYTSIGIGASSSAVAALPVNYYQFIFLVDISGSMAIGGTDAAIAQMLGDSRYNADGGPCAFACHDPHLYHSSRKDFRAQAKADGIKLKIDYVDSAIQTFLTALNTALTKAGAVSYVEIYTYGTSFQTVLSGSKNNMAAAITTAAAIDVESVGPASTNWGYTKTTDALTSLKKRINSIGDGTSANARKTYVVFITDALQDLPKSGATYGRTTDVAYRPGCTAIKALSSDLTLITIEPTYPVVTGNTQYNAIVAPYAALFAPTMKSCASSSSWYFQADDGPGIESAMTKAVVQITNTLRLSK